VIQFSLIVITTGAFFIWKSNYSYR